MKVALVTGGGTGIGAATARRLAADGWAVAITGRRPEPLEALADELGALALPGDVGERADADAAVAATVERFGGLDGLVLNAGRGEAPGSLLDVDPDAFAAAHRVNVLGSLVTARAAIRPLLERKGAVVAVSSVAGLRAAPDSVAYCSSKAALVMLVQCIAVDHGPAGVRANVVCPGWTRTPMGDRAMHCFARRSPGTGRASLPRSTTPHSSSTCRSPSHARASSPSSARPASRSACWATCSRRASTSISPSGQGRRPRWRTRPSAG